MYDCLGLRFSSVAMSFSGDIVRREKISLTETRGVRCFLPVYDARYDRYDVRYDVGAECSIAMLGLWGIKWLPPDALLKLFY